MKRQSKTHATKTRSRKPSAIKRHRTPASPQRFSRRSSESINDLRRELDEARDERAAIEDVLRIISASPSALEPVFTAILENAMRICQANIGSILRYDGKLFHPVVSLGETPTLREFRLRRGSFVPPVGMPLDRVLRSKKVVAADDTTEAIVPPAAQLGGCRSYVVVPMLKDDLVIGAIVIYRQKVRPFTDKQVELLQNFSAQAVIAIENARLLNELHQRTVDLTASLKQQTATAEVLKVISSSPGDLQSIFQTILQNATRLCMAKYGTLFRYDGQKYHLGAQFGTPNALAEFQRKRGPFHDMAPGSSLDQITRTRQIKHSIDEAHEPIPGKAATLGGARSALYVPIVREDVLVGVLVIYRTEVLPFTDKQIALVDGFAAQAVIAIENAQLLSELRGSLERQTATSDVLRVISSSPSELDTVFQTILENATRICEARFGTLFQFDGESFHTVAQVGTPRELAEFQKRRGPFQPAGAGFLELVRSKELVHTVDAAEDLASPAVKYGGARSIICVPMLKEDELIGAIVIYRQEVRSFTDKQIALVRNFASQAVIAIENARLLRELRQRTDQLQAQSRELADLNQQLEQRVAGQVGEIERIGRLRRFLPPQVADLIVASGSEKQLESHRREITALFCDLRGFTGFSESSDPEDVMALLRDYHAAIGEIIIKYSGTLERYAGDGVMVIFNDPVPVDNPALQAVRMALEMRDAIGKLTERWHRLGHDIGFGIGIAHGFATLGTIGFEGRFDYAAIGTVSNVASRLCDEATSGQILITPRVLVAVEGAITVEAVGEFALKGIRRPLAAYNVVAAKSAN